MTGFELARLSLIRRWPATVIAVGALALVTLCSSLLISLLLTLGDPLAGVQTGCELIVGPKSSPLGILLRSGMMWERTEDVIPYSLFRPLRQSANARRLIPLYTFGDHGRSQLVGTDEEYMSLRFGRDTPVLREGRWFRKTFEAVLGREAARTHGLKPGDVFRVAVSPSRYEGTEPLWERDLEVVGILDHGGRPMDQVILVDMETSWDYYRTALRADLIRDTQRQQAVTFFLVSIVREDIARALPLFDRQTVAQVAVVEEEMEHVKRLLSGGKLAVAAMCGAIILLAGFALSTLVNARFEALRPDLGLLRALGYNRLGLASLIFWEALLIGLAAVIVGAAAEGIVLRLVDIPSFLQLPGRELAWPSVWNLGVWLVILASSGVSVAIPLVRIYAMDAHSALRSC